MRFFIPETLGLCLALDFSSPSTVILMILGGAHLRLEGELIYVGQLRQMVRGAGVEVICSQGDVSRTMGSTGNQTQELWSQPLGQLAHHPGPPEPTAAASPHRS